MKKRIMRIICLSLILALAASCATACGGGAGNSGAGGNTGGNAGGGAGTSASPGGGASTSSSPSGGGDAPAQTVHRLSFSIGDPANSSKAMFYQELADRTREATNGGLDITVFSGGTLFAHLEVVEAILSGGADMGWFATAYAPGQFPLADVMSMPLAFGNQMASSYALVQLFKQVPELHDELGMVMLNTYATPTNNIFSVVPINSVDDMRGLQIRSLSGAPAYCLSAWGASPVMMGAGDIYESMDKGVLQGFSFEWSGIASNTLYEVFDYAVNIPVFANVIIVAMNKDSYANIPAEYKDAFDRIWRAEETSLEYARIFTDEGYSSRDYGEAEFGIVELYPDLAPFKVAADEYIASWITEHTTDTFDANAFYTLARELYEEGVKLYPND